MFRFEAKLSDIREVLKEGIGRSTAMPAPIFARYPLGQLRPRGPFRLFAVKCLPAKSTQACLGAAVAMADHRILHVTLAELLR